MCNGNHTPDLHAAYNGTEHVADSGQEQEFTVQENQILGSGRYGKVKMATDRDGKAHALKRYKKYLLTKSELLNLKYEVDIHSGLQHPNIVRLERIFESKREVKLIMECLQGGELYTRIAEVGSLSEPDAARDIRQILLALEYLHANGVVHRDLKLENLVYADASFQCLKLIDFGLSTRWDGHTPLKKLCGTPGYIAPEVWCREYTNLADMWTLGILAYEILLGKTPYPGSEERAAELGRKGLVRFGYSFRGLSQNAQNLLRSLLEIDPAKRLTAAAALGHPWIQSEGCDSLASICNLQDPTLACIQQKLLSKMLSMPTGARTALHEHLNLDKSGMLTFQKVLEVMAKIGYPEDAAELLEELDTEDEAEYCRILSDTLEQAAQSIDKFDADDRDSTSSSWISSYSHKSGSCFDGCLRFLAI